VPAISCAVRLIVDVVLGRWRIGIVCGSVTALVGLLTWYALPLVVRHSGHGVTDPDEDPPQLSDVRPLRVAGR
jgi:hypothetical protein